MALLRETGYPEELCTAIPGHAHYTEVPRETPVAKALFAVDELCGFLIACALVRPSRSLMDLTVKSVKKKLKDKRFAAKVERAEVHAGVAELALDLGEHIQLIIDALMPYADELGLGGSGLGGSA